MPRDLESEKATLERMAPLSKETPPDDDQDPLPLHQSHHPDLLVEDKFKKMKDIHPYSLLLNQEDVDECDWLEHVAFDANEAASKEKVRHPSVSSSSRSSVRIFSAPALLPASPPCTLHTVSLSVSRLGRHQAACFRQAPSPSAIVTSIDRAHVNRLSILGSVSHPSHHCLPISYYTREITLLTISLPKSHCKVYSK